MGSNTTVITRWTVRCDSCAVEATEPIDVLIREGWRRLVILLGPPTGLIDEGCADHVRSLVLCPACANLARALYG